MFNFEYVFFFSGDGDQRDLHVLTHSFPTRRSSDLLLRPLWRGEFAVIRATSIAAAVALLGAASPALAQHKEISPYIEISQVVTDNFTTGDVLTYSQVAAGVDAALTTPNAAAPVSYRYEHSFSWDKDVGDGDVHHGPIGRTSCRGRVCHHV